MWLESFVTYLKKKNIYIYTCPAIPGHLWKQGEPWSDVWIIRCLISCYENRLQSSAFHSLIIKPVQSLSRVRPFATPWITARQASLSITNSRSSPKLMCIKSVMPSSHLSSVVPFSSCPQSLPASGSFPMSQLFAWGGQSTGVAASASVLPMNTQDWSPLGWTGWISLQSKGFARVFSSTMFKSINSSVLTVFLHSPTLTSIHDHWKNHSLD